MRNNGPLIDSRVCSVLRIAKGEGNDEWVYWLFYFYQFSFEKLSSPIHSLLFLSNYTIIGIIYGGVGV